MTADNTIHEMLAKEAAKGQRIRGGCGSCDAYQTLNEVDDGVWSLTVHHDEDCVFLRAMNAEAN